MQVLQGQIHLDFDDLVATKSILENLNLALEKSGNVQERILSLALNYYRRIDEQRYCQLGIEIREQRQEYDEEISKINNEIIRLEDEIVKLRQGQADKISKVKIESETNFGMAADIFHEVLKSTSESDNWKESNKRIILQFSQLRDDLAKVTKEQQEHKLVLKELAHRMEQLKVPFSNEK